VVPIPLAPSTTWEDGTVLDMVREAWRKNPSRDPILVVAGFGGTPVAVVATRDRGLAEGLKVLGVSLHAAETPYGLVLDFAVSLSTGKVFVVVPLDSAVDFLEDIRWRGYVLVVVAYYSGLLNVVRETRLPVFPWVVEKILRRLREAGPPLDPEAAVAYYLARYRPGRYISGHTP